MRLCTKLGTLLFSCLFLFSLCEAGQSVDDLRYKAAQGSASAQDTLGLIYAQGLGVPQNFPEAIKWFRKAASQGYARAQHNLGFAYQKGYGVRQDYAEAVKWYRKAADQGYARAQSTLGIIYEDGEEGVPKDYSEAVKWYRKAADQGFAQAQNNLGTMYYYGWGVPQNDVEAIRWYRKAAEQGNAKAQKNVKDMYEQGRGVSYQDDAKAQVEQKEKAKEVVIATPEPQIPKGPIHKKEPPVYTKKQPKAEPQKRTIPNFKGNGTGFFITEDGYLLTAYHVIKASEGVRLRINKELKSAKVVWTDTSNDIALLKAEGVQCEALPIQTSSNVSVGEQVFTLGFPFIEYQGWEIKYTNGVINSLSGISDDPRMFQISTPVQPGNSGGPLLNYEGFVVGIVVGRLNEITTAKETGALPQNVNYALKSSIVLDFLSSHPELKGKLSKVRNKKRNLSRGQIIKKSISSTVVVLIF